MQERFFAGRRIRMSWESALGISDCIHLLLSYRQLGRVSSLRRRVHKHGAAHLTLCCAQEGANVEQADGTKRRSQHDDHYAGRVCGGCPWSLPSGREGSRYCGHGIRSMERNQSGGGRFILTIFAPLHSLLRFACCQCYQTNQSLASHLLRLSEVVVGVPRIPKCSFSRLATSMCSQVARI
ncbi:hypothetical protein PENSPDRAFT_41932 [Peniophora sp. CONT]|nr:hypothetical protein PENSPDRAFT_41932 [Peniophora sp. CONT]